MNDLVFESRNDGKSAPFSVQELFAAPCLVAFHYREVWPLLRWDLVDPESPNRWPSLEHDHPAIHETRLRWLKESLGATQSDNHQTFLVEIRNYLYFVMFHDGYIWVGDSARGGS